MLPFEVTSDRYCRQLMETLCEISHYMCSVGPEKMSSKKLIQVLASLRPWELQAPDIQSAVEVLNYTVRRVQSIVGTSMFGKDHHEQRKQ